MCIRDRCAVASGRLYASEGCIDEMKNKVAHRFPKFPDFVDQVAEPKSVMATMRIELTGAM
eukprot:7420321-Lingulodinium_polyedra.AAC.1